MTLTRRALLAGAASLAAAAPLVVRAEATLSIHVLKDPNCGCCTAWIDILEAAGFHVTTEARDAEALMRHKYEIGIPQEMVSCHTASIDGYIVEGHVPVADIRRLVAERPQALGLAVPGMPYGSPGMGPEEEREAYDVFLIRRDGGGTELFSRYPAG